MAKRKPKFAAPGILSVLKLGIYDTQNFLFIQLSRIELSRSQGEH